MRKVIFIDVDGTLRDDNKNISDRTIKAIQKARENDYEIILCTGRERVFSEKINASIGGSRYIIYKNGAGLYDTENKLVLYEQAMNKQSILEIYHSIDFAGIQFSLACNGIKYVNKMEHFDDTEELLGENIEEFLEKNNPIAVTIKGTDYIALKNMQPFLETIPDVKIESKSKSLEDANFKKENKVYYDIVDKRVSKGLAIKRFFEITGVLKEQSIAIGDDYNDFSMFEACGYKVAMGNALPILKEKADTITADNNHDGVAQYIEKLLDKEKEEI